MESGDNPLAIRTERRTPSSRLAGIQARTCIGRDSCHSDTIVDVLGLSRRQPNPNTQLEAPNPAEPSTIEDLRAI